MTQELEAEAETVDATVGWARTIEALEAAADGRRRFEDASFPPDASSIGRRARGQGVGERPVLPLLREGQNQVGAQGRSQSRQMVLRVREPTGERVGREGDGREAGADADMSIFQVGR